MECHYEGAIVTFASLQYDVVTAQTVRKQHSSLATTYPAVRHEGRRRYRTLPSRGSYARRLAARPALTCSGRCRLDHRS